MAIFNGQDNSSATDSVKNDANSFRSALSAAGSPYRAYRNTKHKIDKAKKTVRVAKSIAAAISGKVAIAIIAVVILLVILICALPATITNSSLHINDAEVMSSVSESGDFTEDAYSAIQYIGTSDEDLQEFTDKADLLKEKITAAFNEGAAYAYSSFIEGITNQGYSTSSDIPAITDTLSEQDIVTIYCAYSISMNNFTDDDSIEYYSSVSAANDIYNKLQALCLEPNTSYSYGNMLYGIDIATDSSGQPICYTDDSYSEKVSESEEGYVYYVKPSFYMNSVYSISEAAFDINLEDPYDGEEDSTYTYYDYLIDMEQVIGNLLYGDDFLVSDTGVYVPSLSGVGNTDIVSVAYSQLGQQGGRPYWSWYGFSNRVAWCATFVSWCANQCGYLNSSIPKFSSCLDGINWFKRNNQFASRGYVPKAGDIIFFQWSSNERHVGIVTGSDGSRVYTIEGNSSDSVRANSYSIYYKYILGYGVPIYP